MARTISKGTAQPASTPAAPRAEAGVTLADLNIADGIAAPDRPRLKDRPPFLLMVHPERWGVVAGEVVPICGRLTLVNGVSCVKKNEATGKISIEEALTHRRKHGWRPIPLDVDGPGTSYLRSPCKDVYLTRWETAHAGSSVVTSDTRGYVAWLRQLIADGKLPRCPRYVLERLHTRITRRIAELQDRVRVLPSAQIDLEKAQAELKVIEAEMEGRDLTPVEGAPVGLDGVVEEG